MKLIPLLITAILLCFFISCNRYPQKKEIQAVLKNSSVKIIDVRTVKEYESGHIPHSLNYPIESLEDSLLLLNKSDVIITVCRSGNRSKKAKDLLQEHGFINVHDGGTWQNVDKLIEK